MGVEVGANIGIVKYWNYFLLLTILTFSITVFKLVDGFSVSLSVFFILSYLVFEIQSGVYWSTFYKIAALLSYFILIALFHLYNLDTWEFFKSFALTILSFFVFFLTVESRNKIAERIDLKWVVSYSILLIVGFELVQIAEQLLFGSHLTWFLLDKISISTATEVDRFQSVNFLNYFRPVSFFHEPSYLAVILFILFTISSFYNVNPVVKYSAVLGILMSMSTSIILFLIIYFIIVGKKQWLFISILLFGLIISFFAVDIDFKELFRLSEITMEGTSGNERLIKPLRIVYDEVINRLSIFGIPLGQSKVIFDNSFFLLFLYFGILTPILLLSFYLYVRNSIFNIYFISRYLLGIGAILFVNGAFFTPESNVLMFLLNTTYFAIKEPNEAISSNY
jgi:hypothetical protein